MDVNQPLKNGTTDPGTGVSCNTHVLFVKLPSTVIYIYLFISYSIVHKQVTTNNKNNTVQNNIKNS